MNRERPRILLGITGSIAAVKGPRLALLLSQSIKADVKVVLTRTVEQYFWKGGVTESYDEDAWKEFWAVVKSCENVKAGDTEVKDWVSSNGSISIHYAEEEWNNYENLSSPVLHIELRNWADTLLIAPLSAHTLAKIANGLCDDLLSCIVRAWDFGQRKDQNGNPNGKPLILCPAMNTAMWDHVLTRRQLYLIRGFGGCADDKSLVTVVEPVVKKLACGDVGAGALAELEDIVCCVRNCLDAEPISSSGNHRNLPSHDFTSSSIENNTQQTLAARKDAMRKAILRYSKQKFSELQSSHQQDQTQQSSQFTSSLAAPISPTHNDIITLFLPYLKLSPTSLLVDLGCGDGRWLIAATILSKCACLGIDVDDQRLKLTKQSIEKEGLSNKILVRKQDVFEFMEKDFDMFVKADVFIVYLFRDAMTKIGCLLRERLNELKKEVKILCVGFALPQWRAIRSEKSCGLTIYLYGNLSLDL